MRKATERTHWWGPCALALALMLGAPAAVQADEEPADPATGSQVQPRAAGGADEERPTVRKIARSDADASDLEYRKIIDNRRAVPGSLSLGTTSSGILLRQAALPVQGQHHAILGRCRNRSTNFGTEELVEALLDAARTVHETHDGGSRLMIGNMAQRGGGDIPWSRSHNSGRDADIAFYVTRKGKAVDAPDLLRIGPDLTARGGYKLDIPRNWTLVKALLESDSIQVQWLFVATWIRDALLAHAEKQGEKKELLRRAGQVLWQPTDSTPHADHLHLRVYCSKQDRLEGCLNGAPVWDWVDTYEQAMDARLAALEKGLDDPDPDVRVKVVGFLERLDSRRAAGMLATKAVFDEEPKVRLAALDLIRRWRISEPEVTAGLYRARLAHEDLPTWKALWRAIGSSGDAAPVDLLKEGMNSERQAGGVKEKLLATQATAHVMDKRLVPALIDVLAERDPKVRGAAARSLRRITNHSWKVRWDRGLTKKKHRRYVERWREWWSSNEKRGRSALLLRGFKRAGLKVRKLEGWVAVDALVKASKRNDHVGYNAHRVLAVILHRWKATFADNPDRRYRRWNKWWRKNRERMKKRLKA